jgi:hypothetical protein
LFEAVRDPQPAAKWQQEAKELDRLLAEFVYPEGNPGAPAGTPAFGIGMAMEFLRRFSLRVLP